MVEEASPPKKRLFAIPAKDLHWKVLAHVCTVSICLIASEAAFPFFPPLDFRAADSFFYPFDDPGSLTDSTARGGGGSFRIKESVAGRFELGPPRPPLE